LNEKEVEVEMEVEMEVKDEEVQEKVGVKLAGHGRALLFSDSCEGSYF